jgi:hypothetical protein
LKLFIAPSATLRAGLILFHIPVSCLLVIGSWLLYYPVSVNIVYIAPAYVAMIACIGYDGYVAIKGPLSLRYAKIPIY